MESTTVSGFRAVPPEVREISGFSIPQVEVATLANGIRLHVCPCGEEEVCGVGVLLPGGRYEAAADTLPSLASGMARAGSHDFPGDTLSELFESHGAWVNTFPGVHHRQYQWRMLSSSLPVLLPAMVDMVMRPQISAREYELLRGRLGASVDTQLARVGVRATRAAMELYLGAGHPLACRSTREDYLATELEEVMAWHRRSLHAPEINVTITGRVTPGMVEQVGRAFEAIGTVTDPIVAADSPLNTSAPGAVSHVRMDDALQSAITMILPTIPPEHPDFSMLRMATVALCGYFGSRLNMNIREDKGLTYGIGGGLVSLDSHGFATISTHVDCANVEAVCREVEAEIKRLSSGDFTVGEVTRVRRARLAEVAQTLATPFSFMDAYEMALTQGDEATFLREELDTLASATPATLASAARHLHPSPLTAIAGR